ncbi:uncharacterized protein LOC110907214 [Helianthus annuus]|uniref:uncharacterized protein LOC110907214 n=1 Tax=Helianthus annuus TaxID=4232 RepID=UPI000B8F7A92|nr:uncharacterized protein LOC110907214 [Helianthus annuus]
MADDFPLWFPPDSSDDSSDDSILFFQNLLEEAELQDTGTSNQRRYIERQREVGHETLMADYFVEDPKYNDAIFRQRFRMSKRLFLNIVTAVEANDEYFQESYDARGRRSFTPLQKVTSAIKQLATGNPPDEGNEYLHMAARTSRECLEYFCETVCRIYGSEFLRRPTSHDMTLLYDAHEEQHHLPGMFGSLDCTHFVWRMCPTELRGQYMRGDHRYPTIMLEAATSQDLWIWHAFCGPPGARTIAVILNGTKWNRAKMSILRQQPLLQTWLFARGWNLPKMVRVCEIDPIPSRSRRKDVQKATRGGKKRRRRGFWGFEVKMGCLESADASKDG